MKNQGNMTPSKERSKFPVYDAKEMEIQELPEKEFKVIVIKMLIQLQKKYRQLIKSRKLHKNKMRNFNKEIENIKNQRRILEL